MRFYNVAISYLMKTISISADPRSPHISSLPIHRWTPPADGARPPAQCPRHRISDDRHHESIVDELCGTSSCKSHSPPPSTARGALIMNVRIAYALLRHQSHESHFTSVRLIAPLWMRDCVIVDACRDVNICWITCPSRACFIVTSDFSHPGPRS